MSLFSELNVNNKSRNNHPIYVKDNILRIPIFDAKVPWHVKYPEYVNLVKKNRYTHKSVLESSINIYQDVSFTKSKWADPENVFSIYLIQDNNWYSYNVSNRISNEKNLLINNKYLIDGFEYSQKSGIFGAPLYPGGRTGICGRGLLGKWGPNQAADPIITRINPTTKKLEMIGIIRKDTGELAIPGGMVDPGEKAKTTALRELFEEALGDSNKLGSFKQIFEENAQLIYSGVVDDPRNTDNAWIETQVYHLHVEDEDLGKELEEKLKAGDDANKAHFVEIDPIPPLYASHEDYIKFAINKINQDNNYYQMMKTWMKNNK